MNDHHSDRIRSVNDKPVNEDGEFIVYWMIATRRFNYNSSLEFAAQLAVEHNVPLLVIEEISTSHRFANDRIYRYLETTTFATYRGLKHH
jgi:deoxyribodipyrimidine photo-lyase